MDDKPQTTPPEYDKADLIKQCKEWQKLANTDAQKRLIEALIYHLENPNA